MRESQTDQTNDTITGADHYLNHTPSRNNCHKHTKSMLVFPSKKQVLISKVAGLMDGHQRTSSQVLNKTFA